MATIKCPAEHIFSDGQVPCPHGWTLISESNFDKALDDLLELARKGGDFDGQAMPILASHGLPSYICPECGRLLVFRNGLDKPATIYKPE